MPFKSLSSSVGYLVVGATPVRLTVNMVTGAELSSEGARYAAHTIFVQQHADNTSKIYLLDRATGSGTTGVGVLTTLVAPFSVSGSLTGLAWLAVTIPFSPGGLNIADYWLVADASSQKVTASVIQA